MIHRWLCVCSSLFRIVVFHPTRQPPPTPPSIHATKLSHPLAIHDATNNTSLPILHPNRQPSPTPPSIHATRLSHPLAIRDATTDNSLPIPHPDPALRVLPDELLDPRAESVNGPGVPMGRNGGRVPNPVRRIPPRPPPRRPTTTTSATCPLPWSKHSGGARLVPSGG